MQDLKSEFGNMCADVSSILKHLGIAEKKQKPYSHLNKQGKVQASLANIKAPMRKAKAVATSFPKHYVDQDDSAASDSDDHCAPTERAMFARVKMAPLPNLTVQSIYGQNSSTDLVKSNAMWDADRIGLNKPSSWPHLHEAGMAAAKATHDSPNQWEDNASKSSASSKN